MKKRFLVSVFICAGVLSACTVNAGTIVGKVVVKGDVSLEPEKAMAKEDLIKFKKSLVISEKGGLANSVIYVNEEAKEKFNAEGINAIMDQKEETYIPHVLAVLQGTTVDFLNSDNILHNVHTYLDGETVFNRAMPVYKKKSSKVFDVPGIVSVACDVHPHMQAYIYVLENPYFAVSNEGGLFVIKDVPPGTYEIKLWHERLNKELSTTVQVKADGKSPVVFEVPAGSL